MDNKTRHMYHIIIFFYKITVSYLGVYFERLFSNSFQIQRIELGISESFEIRFGALNQSAGMDCVRF